VAVLRFLRTRRNLRIFRPEIFHLHRLAFLLVQRGAHDRESIFPQEAEVGNPMAMVDSAGDDRGMLFIHPKQLAQVVPGYIHPDAQSNALDLRQLVDGLSIDRQGVGEIIKSSIWTQLFHVPTNLDQHRHVAQRPRQPAGATGITHRLNDAVFVGNIHVERPNVHAAHANRGSDNISAGKHLSPIGGGLDRPIQTKLIRDALGETPHHIQNFRVDVHQPDGRAAIAWIHAES
jgi:hypothetical protein